LMDEDNHRELFDNSVRTIGGERLRDRPGWSRTGGADVGNVAPIAGFYGLEQDLLQAVEVCKR
jgi:hypothetical protein